MRQEHGQTRGGVLTPEYRSWRKIKERCFNPKDKGFALYSQRGMWPPWRTDFLAFLEHIGPRPSPWHSVERIDNTKGYIPGNVRWATAGEQANNTRRNVWLEHDGRRLTVAQWARALGMSQYTIHDRLKSGWSPERALTEPRRRMKT